MDERRRQLERDDSPAGRARVLVERVRAGTLAEDRVMLAAYLGDEASALAMSPAAPCCLHAWPIAPWLAQLNEWQAGLTGRVALAAAGEVLYRVRAKCDQWASSGEPPLRLYRLNGLADAVLVHEAMRRRLEIGWPAPEHLDEEAGRLTRVCREAADRDLIPRWALAPCDATFALDLYESGRPLWVTMVMDAMRELEQVDTRDALIQSAGAWDDGPWSARERPSTRLIRSVIRDTVVPWVLNPETKLERRPIQRLYRHHSEPLYDTQPLVVRGGPPGESGAGGDLIIESGEALPQIQVFQNFAAFPLRLWARRPPGVRTCNVCGRKWVVAEELVWQWDVMCCWNTNVRVDA